MLADWVMREEVDTPSDLEMSADGWLLMAMAERRSQQKLYSSCAAFA